jgi:hypothetical protein
MLLIRVLGELGENPDIVVQAIPDDFNSMSGQIHRILRTYNQQPRIALGTWLYRLLLGNEVPDFVVAEDGVDPAVVYHQGVPSVIGLPQTIEDAVLNDNSAGGQIGLAIGKNRHLGASLRAGGIVGQDEPLDGYITVLPIPLAVSTNVESPLALSGRVYGWPTTVSTPTATPASCSGTSKIQAAIEPPTSLALLTSTAMAEMKSLPVTPCSIPMARRCFPTQQWLLSVLSLLCACHSLPRSGDLQRVSRAVCREPQRPHIARLDLCR